MSNLKSGVLKTKSKSKVLGSVAPIKRTLVDEGEKRMEVKDILQNAGEQAENLTKTANLEQKNEIVATGIEEPKQLSIDNLLGSLNDIDKKFETITDKDYYKDALTSDIPESLVLEKMEVPEIDEEKIKKEITAEKTRETEEAKQEEIKEVEEKTKLQQEKIENLKSLSESEKEEIGRIYDDYKASAESDAIKRGLARSSVAILSMDNIEAGRAQELSRVAENLTKSISGVEAEIEKLQQNLEISLSNLDLELAENINKALEKKILDLKDKQKEAIEFNNNVNKLEAEYQIKRRDDADRLKALEEELMVKYEGKAQQDKAEQKFQTAIKYFDGLDKTEALRQIINSPELASSLGNAYYDLYYYVMRK